MVIGLAGFTDALTILDPLLIDDHFALIFVSLRLIVCHLVLLAVRVALGHALRRPLRHSLLFTGHYAQDNFRR